MTIAGFISDEKTAKIKAAFEAGNIVEAQRMILDEIATWDLPSAQEVMHQETLPSSFSKPGVKFTPEQEALIKSLPEPKYLPIECEFITPEDLNNILNSDDSV